MSFFTKAMSSVFGRTTTEKGAPAESIITSKSEILEKKEKKEISDVDFYIGNLVPIFDKLVRNFDEKKLLEMLNDLDERELLEDNLMLENLIVLAFQTRDTRNNGMGKGERTQSYNLFYYLWRKTPELFKSLLHLIPEYGSWLDICKLWEYGQKKSDITFSNLMVELYAKELASSYYSYRINKFNLYQKIYDTPTIKKIENRKISLAAKWAPRESNHYKKMSRQIAKKLFTHNPSRASIMYRKNNSLLNTYLDTTEVKMCGNKYSNINFSNVTSRCMFKNRFAFRNKTKNGSTRKEANEDRDLCAKNLEDFLENVKKGEKKINCGQMFLHELIKTYIEKVIYSNNIYERETTNKLDEVIEAQWKENVRKFKENGILGKIVPLADVSGSMNGEPMYVSIALSLLIAETTHPAFSGHILTFSEIPQWFKVDLTSSLYKKTRELIGMKWGMRTNFEACYEKILEICKRSNIKEEDLPEYLAVFSDMQFDKADSTLDTSSLDTHFEIIKKKFQDAGYSRAPKIIFWNLRGVSGNMPAKCSSDNVIILSGFSKSMLKLFMDGKFNKIKSPTPIDGLREILYNEHYDRIRNIFRKNIEKDV